MPLPSLPQIQLPLRFLACCGLALALRPPPAPAETTEPPKERRSTTPDAPGKPEPSEGSDEEKVRKRFWEAFNGAADANAKADAILALQGLKEPASKRILTGLLGNSLPEVRAAACRVMDQDEDPQGYFIQPLCGALSDRSPEVRIRAAAALGDAKLKKGAIQQLIFALKQLDGAGPNAPATQKEVRQALVASLIKLTGQRLEDESAGKDPAKAWTAWWEQNRKRIEQEDRQREEQNNPAPNSGAGKP